MNVRREYINDCIKRYIEEYPDEYLEFQKIVKQRRDSLNDKKFAEINGVNEMRLAATFPQKLYEMIRIGLDGKDEKAFLEESGESKWFYKKYPQFLIPNEY